MLIQTIEKKFECGELDEICLKLVTFIRHNINEILEHWRSECRTWDRCVDLQTAIKTFLLRKGSVDMSMDMKAQVEAMKKEIERRMSEGDSDITRIKTEWTQKYAGIWREYRTLEIIYAFDRNKEKCLRVFEEIK
ncbi:MAG: hypothetical protein ACLFQK_11865 [Fibrobacterota bacterium]